MFVNGNHVRINTTVKFTHVQSLFPSDRNSPETNIICPWQDCKVTGRHLSKIRQHMSIHTGEKRIGCFHCGTLLDRHRSLNDHLNRQEQDVKKLIFKCVTCKKDFLSNNLLKEHEKNHKFEFECVTCTKKFTSAINLSKHTLALHFDGIKVLECKKCDYRTSLQSSLKQHAQKHAVDRQTFDCSQCSKTFQFKNTLKSHEKTHEGRRFCCHLCVKDYLHQSSLQQHLINKHKMDRPVGCNSFQYKEVE
jgi:KRAB domain-containing zinc finger protein